MSQTLLGEFSATLPYPLDDFQEQGCRVVEDGHGVLVCAPTGAGKTVVGEFAVFVALARGTKCFYTTPIKALSNQKYHDLVAVHGEDAIGLLTGDVSINPGAEIVVMTTEVLRNMIYAESAALDRLSHVVMDEIHFLADASRGAVWEEVILNLDEHVSIIGLSATVSNSEEFGDWLSTVRGDTAVIVSEHRPVPLDQWMM
ncbi:MAG: DEAD/DEAH box helicase, partial [Corynebacterium flavescens]